MPPRNGRHKWAKYYPHGEVISQRQTPLMVGFRGGRLACALP